MKRCWLQVRRNRRDGFAPSIPPPRFPLPAPLFNGECFSAKPPLAALRELRAAYFPIPAYFISPPAVHTPVVDTRRALSLSILERTRLAPFNRVIPTPSSAIS